MQKESISFSRLGDYGRLGNQMFQYAFLRNKANELGVFYSCPHWLGDDLFELGETKRIVADIPAGKHKYTEDPKYNGFNESTRDIVPGTDIIGYFQTERYFGNQARTWFQFKDRLRSQSRLPGMASLHVRLTDYVEKQQYHPIPKISYYQRALDIVGEKKIMVLSDDIPKARTMLSGIKTHEFQFSDNVKDYQDMRMMSACDDNIMANSSFSWWGAYLNSAQDKKVIYPEFWFTEAFGMKNNEIGCDRWIALDGVDG